MSKKKTTVVAMSQTNIDRLAKTESEFQKLKGERADAYNSIQEKKLDQYATLISHVKVIFNDNKTDSDNLPRQVGIQIREDLMNDVGMSKANSKMLYENTVKFLAKFDKDIPSQATPESVLEVFSSMDISTQNDLKKKVSKQVDDNIGDTLARKLFGKMEDRKRSRKMMELLKKKKCMFLVNILLKKYKTLGKFYKMQKEKETSLTSLALMQLRTLRIATI